MTSQVRVLFVLRLVAERPRTVADMAEHLAVPTRMVYRDLDAIKMAGVIVKVDGVPFRGATYHVEPDTLPTWARSRTR